MVSEVLVSSGIAAILDRLSKKSLDAQVAVINNEIQRLVNDIDGLTNTVNRYENTIKYLIFEMDDYAQGGIVISTTNRYIDGKPNEGCINILGTPLSGFDYMNRLALYDPRGWNFGMSFGGSGFIKIMCCGVHGNMQGKVISNPLQRLVNLSPRFIPALQRITYTEWRDSYYNIPGLMAFCEHYTPQSLFAICYDVTEIYSDTFFNLDKSVANYKFGNTTYSIGNGIGAGQVRPGKFISRDLGNQMTLYRGRYLSSETKFPMTAYGTTNSKSERKNHTATGYTSPQFFIPVVHIDDTMTGNYHVINCRQFKLSNFYLVTTGNAGIDWVVARNEIGVPFPLRFITYDRIYYKVHVFLGSCSDSHVYDIVVKSESSLVFLQSKGVI